MEAKEAIEIPTTLAKQGKGALHHDSINAVQLGIDALNRHNGRHQLSYADLMLPLTGETVPTDSPNDRSPSRLGILAGYARELIHPICERF